MSSSEKLSWDKSLEFGIDKIDNQHKELFELVNRLYAIKDENFKEEMRDILYRFRKYMIEHFEDEEIYMENIGFPDLINHVQLHKNIINSITNIIHHSSNINILKSRLKIMAKKVVVEHIKNEDMKIKLFMMNNDIKITEKIFEIPIK